MTTDRELLELAAKAYWGEEIDDVCSIRWLEEDQAIGYTHGDNQDHNGEDREFVWNPLTDDGDALRLAVKLLMTIDLDVAVEGCACVVWCRGADFEDADYRRAIVRAAASIGQQMEK